MNVPIGRLAREELNRRQKDGKRSFLLHRCREHMMGGNFRPTAGEITNAVHDIGNLFGNLPRLYEQALDDHTVATMATRICNDLGALGLSECHRIARAAVFGRLST